MGRWRSVVAAAGSRVDQPGLRYEESVSLRGALSWRHRMNGAGPVVETFARGVVSGPAEFAVHQKARPNRCLLLSRKGCLGPRSSPCGSHRG